MNKLTFTLTVQDTKHHSGVDYISRYPVFYSF